MSSTGEDTSSTMTEVTKSMSSFQFFQKLRMATIREELVRTEQEADMASVMRHLSARWKSLSDEERAEFDDMAARDKERFLQETAQRDEEYLALQEERRRQNATTTFDHRARSTTLAKTDAVISKSEAPKRKREISEADRQARDKVKQAKAEEQRRIDEQHDDIAKSKAAQAEARLKYLLGQSDVFSHFGLKASTPQEATPSKKEERDRDRKRDRKGVVYDELDDDELALMKEAGADSDDDSDSGKLKIGPQHVLTRQPSIITGGEMRYVQWN